MGNAIIKRLSLLMQWTAKFLVMDFCEVLNIEDKNLSTLQNTWQLHLIVWPFLWLGVHNFFVFYNLLDGWHYQLNGHKFELTPGDSEGQGSLVWCSPWVRKELDDNSSLFASGLSCGVQNLFSCSVWHLVPNQESNLGPLNWEPGPRRQFPS